MNERLNAPPIATPKTKETPHAYQGIEGVQMVSKTHQPTAIGAFKLNFFSELGHLAKFAKEEAH